MLRYSVAEPIDGRSIPIVLLVCCLFNCIALFFQLFGLPNKLNFFQISEQSITGIVSRNTERVSLGDLKRSRKVSPNTIYSLTVGSTLLFSSNLQFNDILEFVINKRMQLNPQVNESAFNPEGIQQDFSWSITN